MIKAIKYGAPDSAVRVTLHGEETHFRLEVSNTGHLETYELEKLFDPLRRGTGQGESHDAREGLGLGLFIAREVAKAHGGEIEARCAGEQTTFEVRLPRHGQDA